MGDGFTGVRLGISITNYLKFRSNHCVNGDIPVYKPKRSGLALESLKEIRFQSRTSLSGAITSEGVWKCNLIVVP